MKKTMIILSTLVLAVVVTGHSVSGTYAKYTSTGALTDTARVAKWAINVEGAPMTASTTIDLFKYADSNVKNTDGTVDGLIAPGTSGSFAIDIQNVGEVNAKYSIAFTATNSNNIPIEYSIDGTSWSKTIADINVTDVNINMDDAASTKTVYWRWVFEVDEDTDSTDTTLGLAGTAEVTVTATITATQID